MQQHRLIFLDGIRGLAAIFVLTRHTNSFWCFEIHRCYLAVDIFFILSGFVIAYSYDTKILNNFISLWKFIKIRIIRLYPVFFISILLCLIILILNRNQLNADQFKKQLMVIGITALFIPSHTDGKPELFSINAPYWSLFYEIIINFLYAATRKFINQKILFIIIITNGSGLIALSFVHENIDAGFFTSLQSVVAGFIRSLFGFYLGLCIYKNQSLFKNIQKIFSPWVSFLLISICLLTPNVPKYNWIIDLLLIFSIIPLSIIIASKNSNTKLKKPLIILGSASYPRYVLHKPLSEILQYFTQNIERTYAPISGIFFTIFIVYLSVSIEKYYDIPLRRKLKQYIL